MVLKLRHTSESGEEGLLQQGVLSPAPWVLVQQGGGAGEPTSLTGGEALVPMSWPHSVNHHSGQRGGQRK